MIAIDFNLLISALTPPVHRSIEVIAAIRSKYAPLEQLKDQFNLFQERIDYEMTWNGQVCMLEHLLNLEFDPINNGIFITDGVPLDKKYLFNEAESNEPTYIHNDSEPIEPTYIYNDSEVANYHFIVNVPLSVTFDENLLKFFVNKYRLAGKRWKIDII
jgi:hypothetical protein